MLGRGRESLHIILTFYIIRSLSIISGAGTPGMNDIAAAAIRRGAEHTAQQETLQQVVMVWLCWSTVSGERGLICKSLAR